MAYKYSDYTVMINVMPQTWFWCWNSPWWWRYKHFVFPSTTIAHAHAWAFIDIGSTALRRVPQKFWLHCHDCCHVLMLMCWSSPWWQSC